MRTKEKWKVEIGKSEMNQGRLTEEFRDRTKSFAAGVVRLYVKLPKAREEVRILGKPPKPNFATSHQ
jgi:hypothetical protein